MTTDLLYYDIACELLDVDGLQFHKVEGVYFNGGRVDVSHTFGEEIEDELCRQVCLLLPELSPKDWPSMIDATGQLIEKGYVNERLVLMLRAVKNKDAEQEESRLQDTALWLGDGKVQVGDDLISLEPQMAEVLLTFPP